MMRRIPRALNAGIDLHHAFLGLERIAPTGRSWFSARTAWATCSGVME
jgi:hypothetical protein